MAVESVEMSSVKKRLAPPGLLAHSFKPGCKPGPGRPSREFEAGGLKLLASVCDIEARKEIIRAMIRKACDGDVPAATWLWDRLYGKPTETIRMLGLLREDIERMSNEELDAELRARGLEWAIQ